MWRSRSVAINANSNPLVLEPGLVIVKQCLGTAVQQWLSGLVLQRGLEAPGRGFWQISASGRREPNSSPRNGRGRIYDSIFEFPTELSQLCEAVLQASRSADSTLPCMKPTHVRLLHYSCGKGVAPLIQWHRDNDPNDGQADRPIATLSIGLRCTLLLSHKHPLEQSGEVHQVQLESGDAYVLGGPCRRMFHSVKHFVSGTCPEELVGNVGEARLVVSFHDAPGVDASAYASFSTASLPRRGWEALWRPPDNSQAATDK